MFGKGKLEMARVARMGLLALLTTVALTGCGGGSGGSGGGSVTPPTGSPSGTPNPPPTSPPPVPQNKPPVISGAPVTTLKEGEAYSFQPTASDPDGDTLSFSASGLPAWLAINGNTGQLSGTAPAGSGGNHGPIVVTVSDGKASASLPAFTISVAPPPVSSKAELNWTAPTQNEDGSALTNLAGYKVRYGQALGALDKVLDVPSAATTRVIIDGLTAGTWYFTVASYTNTGVESAPTGAVSKTIG